MNIFERAKNMIMAPKTEWPVVAREATSAGALYTGYIIPLAAIGPLASFLGLTLFGVTLPLVGSLHFSLATRITTAVVSYGLGLVGVFLISLLINALAPTFGGQRDALQALKVAAFSYTPAWVAGLFHLVPMLGILVLLASLYSLYVLYLGLPVLMKAPEDRAAGYTAAVVVCALVLGLIIGIVQSTVLGTAPWSRHAAFGGVDGGEPFDRLKAMGATRTGAPSQAQAAMGAMMAAGARGPVEPVDQNLLKAMLPESLEGLKRTQSEATRVGPIARASASYRDDQGRSVELNLTDAGFTGAMGLTAWANIEQDQQTEDGYEKMGKVEGRPFHEKFNHKSMDGEYAVVVAGRFIAEARGRNVDMAMLRQSLQGVGYTRLEALKDTGVRK